MFLNTPIYRLKGALKRALGALYAVLDAYTLADLADGDDWLTSLLQRDSA